MEKNTKNSKKKTNISREDLAAISYRLESTFAINRKDLLVQKKGILKREDIINNYKHSALGKIEKQIDDSRSKLGKKIESLSLDIDAMRTRITDISEADKTEILKTLKKRGRKGTINNDLDELTIELGQKVKKIRKATKQAKKILDSSTLKDKKTDDSINLKEYRVLYLPKKSLKSIFILKKSIIFYSLMISSVIILLIVLLVVFLV